MSAAEILALARCDSVTMTVAADGKLCVSGPEEARAWWLPKIQAVKADIIALRHTPATVVVEAHGHRFAIATGPGAPAAEGCITLTAGEVAKLGAAGGDAQLPAAMVGAIAKVKAVFPGAKVDSARVLAAATGSTTR